TASTGLLTGNFELSSIDLTTFNPSHMATSEAHLAIVLTLVPFLLPFEYRFAVFRALLEHDRLEHARHIPPGVDAGLTIHARIRRQFLYEVKRFKIKIKLTSNFNVISLQDAFDNLSVDNAPDLKKRIRCELVNFAGIDEVGIDGGGLFRELMHE